MTIHSSPESADTYGGPFIIKEIDRNPGSYLTTATIADAVTIPGRSRVQTVETVRHFAKVGLLLPARRETEGRQCYLYGQEQVIAAEVLIRQLEAGVRDRAAQQAVFRAINVWKEDDFEGGRPAPSPGAHMILDYEAGARDWTVEVWSFRHREYGQVRFSGRISANQRGQGTTLDVFKKDGFDARAVFAVDVIDFLDTRYGFLSPRGLN